MPGGINLATKYSKEIDERWTSASLISYVNGKYSFKGDRTVVVYSCPTAPMNDYQRSGLQRYGTPDDLTRNTQTLTMSQDKGFTYIIDRGDEIQSEGVMNPGAALDRQIREQVAPEFDRYCFRQIVASAVNNGHTATTTITKSNAHEMFLNGIQHLCDRNVLLDGVVAYCTFAFLNFMMQDASFVRYGDKSQDMITRGEIGMADGVKLIQVPPTKLPAGAAFLLVHKDAIVAPHQLQTYKTHEDPVGVNGIVCEGRAIYDCFVLNEKANGIYYHGGQSVMKLLLFATGAAADGQSKIIMYTDKEKSANTWYAKTAVDQASLPAVSMNTAIDITSTTSAWYGGFAVTSREMLFTPTEGHTRIRIVEVGSNSKPVAYGDENVHVEL